MFCATMFGNLDVMSFCDSALRRAPRVGFCPHEWDSPRGPMSIDPETRDVVQTIYIRKVEKVSGELVNVPFDKVENVKDPVKARMKK